MIYTKNGGPLTQSGNNLYSRSGKHVARLRDKKAYAPDGRHVGTLVGDCFPRLKRREGRVVVSWCPIEQLLVQPTCLLLRAADRRVATLRS
jgi:hypothetical protein